VSTTELRSAPRPPLSRPTHVLLDLDGTISDSAPGIARSLRYAFETCGYEPPTDEAVRTVIGPPFEVGLPTLGIHIDDLERVVAAYRVRYEDVGLFENTVYPGIGDMLEQLVDAGHILSIATAKPEPTAIRIIEHFGFSDYFEVQAGATVDVGAGRRTKAQVIDDALIRLQLTPADLGNVVMVGDRDHDVEGAHLNGIDCVGVTWGFGSAEELRGAGAAVLVDTPAEVAAAVLATYRSVGP
jgi:phosphoglycolate phosphatase